ncbi:anti-sigma factor [Variovorax humicola]|uniref:Anti-sigma factor n=1 Tax=Variovorax humicola TaxID=1769758 RepID=A0ABU8W6N5_9BURK
METPEDATLSALIRQHATRHAPPDALAERIRAALPNTAPVPSAGPFARWRRALESLALYGAGVATAWVAASMLLVTPAPDSKIQEEVTASHVRSLLADHLSDIHATNHHTVKPWFAGKVDFSPPVIDLADEGFPMSGGRLDYLEGRTVAALVYGHGSHVINLFVWPADAGQGGAQPPRLSTRQGYNLAHWTAAGMNAWAISDVDATELQAFAELVRTRMGAAGSPQ